MSLDYALRYAALGIPVFRCADNAKVPATANGFKDATTSQEAIKSWRGAFNIGTPTGSLWWVLDIDPRHGGTDSLMALQDKHGELPSTLIARTPSGGMHIYFAADSRAVNTAGKLGPGLDTRGTGGYVLIEGSSVGGKAYQFQDWDVLAEPIPELAKAPEWLMSAAFEAKRLAPITQGQVIEGARNVALTQQAGRLRRLGFSQEEIYAALTALNASRCNPKLEDAEVRTIATSVARYAPAEAPKQAAPSFPSVFLDDAKTEQETNPIIKGLFNRGDSAMIFGQSGCGKSFFAIDMSGTVAANLSWRGKRVRQAPVVYIAAEAGKSILRRFAAWRDTKMGEAREERIPLKIIPRSANLLDDLEAGSLMAALHLIAEEIGAPLGLIVVDTVSRMIPGGDENSAQDMTKVVQFTERVRDELGAATLVVHHSGKDATKGARGSNSLYSAMDCVISIGDGVATVLKSRDGQNGETFPFQLRVIDLGLDEDGDPVTTCVVEHQASERKAKGVSLNASEKIAMSTLRQSLDAFGATMPETSTIPGGKRAIKMEQWRSAFHRAYGEDKTDEATKKAFHRAKTELIASKMVGASAPWVWAW